MNEGGRAKVDICNGTLHSGGTCPIIKVVSKGGYGEILGVECTALVLRAWNYAMQTTEKLHTLGHSFRDEYFALSYGQRMSVTNWLASMAPRKKRSDEQPDGHWGEPGADHICLLVNMECGKISLHSNISNDKKVSTVFQDVL